MASPGTRSKKRIVLLFGICCAVFLTLTVRLGWIQIINAEKYSNLAINQQTRDTPITPVRGIIYDRNMTELAVNAPTYTVWVWPSQMKQKEGNVTEMAVLISDITEQGMETVTQSLQKEASLVRVAKNLSLEQADALRKLMKDEKLPGLSIAEDTKRYYPYGNFASHILGHTTDDNSGISGIELKYNDYLTGTSGRIIKNTDASGRQLAYGTEKYYEAENGLNVVLTIDEVLQHYLEKALEHAYNDSDALKTMAIAMDPNTGAILAMGIYPGYDLNNARMPILEKDIAEYQALETSEEQTDYWNKMWRNFMVSDTYEPGSTFKLITTAIALEEGKTSLSDTFTCTGYLQVADQMLRCWRYYNPHGTQTLSQAVQNSCNPVFMTLAQRIGATKYSEYLETFGLTEKTGVDYTGEAAPIIQRNIGPVELATISYGHGISITPLQLITALSSVANGGDLMQPRLVEKVLDDEGNVIYNNPAKIVRKTVSEQTALEMQQIMADVVSSGSGNAAYVPGYRVGGKTGTADKVEDGRYKAGAVFASFFGIAPADDPQIAILFIVDEPTGTHFGSQVAAPYVKEFLEEALPYLNVEPIYTADEQALLDVNAMQVPNVTGMNVEQARSTLTKQGFVVQVLPEYDVNGEKEVYDQYPKSGSKLNAGETVYLYTE